MSPLQSFLTAGDRLDDWAAGLATAFAAAAPASQLVGAGDAVPSMSVTSAVVLVILTLGRMHFGHARLIEDNRHKEAVIRLEVERIMASKAAPVPSPVPSPEALSEQVESNARRIAGE